MLAPIVIFCYKRLDHLKRVIEALQLNKLSTESDLIIYSDGPKDLNSNELIDSIRSYASNLNGFKSVQLICRQSNFGLTKNIEEGITEVLDKYDKVIVLEDDIIVTSVFLNFMNEALDLYSNNANISCVSGYTFLENPEGNHFFLKGAECWGWGTWKRAWFFYEKDIDTLIRFVNKNKSLRKQIGYGTNFYYRMLLNTKYGKINSWAIKWHVSAYMRNMLTLFPSKSYVYNIGLDSSGEHGRSEHDLNYSSLQFEYFKLNFIQAVESKKMYSAFSLFIKNRFSLYGKILSYIRNVRFQIYNLLKNNCSDQILILMNYLFNKKYKGPYESFEKAKLDSVGYHEINIAKRVLDVSLMRKNRIIISERDGFILPNIQLSSNVRHVFQKFYNSGNSISVFDFGGGFGSWYFDIIDLYGSSIIKKWVIVEQDTYVRVGKKLFEDDRLEFFSNLNNLNDHNTFDLILLSGVLQYIETPYDLLSKINQIDSHMLILDRTPFWNGHKDKCFVQINAQLADSYPSWIFNEEYFLNFMNKYWVKVNEFYTLDNQYLSINMKRIRFKGFVFKKRNCKDPLSPTD
jgi:putative methyltransferase (TIGR04325 family)